MLQLELQSWNLERNSVMGSRLQTNFFTQLLQCIFKTKLATIKCPMGGIPVVYRVSDSGEKKYFFLSQYWNNVTFWFTFRTQHLGPDQLTLFTYNRSLFNKYWILIWLRTWLLESEQNQSAFTAHIMTASTLFPGKICSCSVQGLPRTETSCCDKASSGLALPQHLPQFCSSFQSLKYF